MEKMIKCENIFILNKYILSQTRSMELYDKLQNLELDTSNLNNIQLSRTINLIDNKDIYEQIAALIIHHFIINSNGQDINFQNLYHVNSITTKGPIFNCNHLPAQLLEIIKKYVILSSK